ncbi:aminoglycoside phosphotransferase family protein [Pseudonocardia spirodelae]|uniref:Aminoglycoside phosphotransferase family protein n=1 Tax=Pseudonocardia spirodelae TaxID=3133431 RepID=A0ABU8T3W5_9PSEU
MSVPDDAWLAPLARRLRRTPVVTGRVPLTGGHASGPVERIDLDDGTAVVLKRAGTAEVAALRAAAVVTGPVRVPRLLVPGDGWVLLAHEPGATLAPGDPVPDDVWVTLARTHAHWRRNRPRGVPLVDDDRWSRLCALAADRLAAAGSAAAATVGGWAGDERVRTALRALPRTLCHGDAHRGNVLTGPAGAVLLDWGNARVAPGTLDVVVLSAPPADGPADAPPSPVPALYRDTLHAALGAPDPPAMIAVETAWARVQAHVQYLPFAAEHQDTARTGSMVRVAAAALDELGGLLSAARAG